MNKEELKFRTKSFAVRVFNFIIIESSNVVDVISYQLLKAFSSVAANYRAACRGKSSGAIFSAAIQTIKSRNPDSLILNPK